MKTMTGTLTYGTDTIRYEVRFLASRQTLANGFHPDSRVLVRAPLPCIEYVVTHELCHIRHRDHDARFFRLLEQVMPDWEQRKQRLEAALL